MLPEQLFGMDTDDVLAYQTPKLALIRDRHVGALYYALTMAALGWVLIGQVLWRNEHFLLKDVRGIPRMFINHPTRNMCDPNVPDCLSDFKKMVDLPYCEEFRGGPAAAHPAACVYADKHTMFPEGTVGTQIFVPTSVVMFEEVKHCNPSASNHHSCENEYQKDWDGRGYYFNETEMQYYADIEDFTIQFTSTYHREHIEGTSLDHPGFFEECFDKIEGEGKPLGWEERLQRRDKECEDLRRLPVECVPGMHCEKGGLKTIEDVKIPAKVKVKDLKVPKGDLKVPEGEFGGGEEGGVSFVSSRRLRSRGTSPLQLEMKTHTSKDHEEEPARPTPDVYASTWGDTFKLGKLMQLAHIDLDHHYNMDNMTARMAGTIIEVEATYTNLRRFLSSLGLSQVQYTYRVKERKLPYVSRETLHPDQPVDFPRRRRYVAQHGILVNFQVGGEFGFFNVVYLLIMLTTSLALIATADKITMLTALYLHPRQKNYFHLKYDVSADFSDMWKCKECGYFNVFTDQTCKGMEKWESIHDKPFCGAAMPGSYRERRESKQGADDERPASD